MSPLNKTTTSTKHIKLPSRFAFFKSGWYDTTGFQHHDDRKYSNQYTSTENAAYRHPKNTLHF